MESPGEIRPLVPEEISENDWHKIRQSFQDKLAEFERYGGDKDQFFFLALKTTIREFQLMKLATLAERDPLMPYLYNRLGSTNNLAKEVARYKRAMANGKSKGITIIASDMDNFKIVNDAHGHAAGDGILRYAACTILDCLRATDAVGRLGDLGLVAEKLSSLRKQGSINNKFGSRIQSGMTVKEVFEKLLEIAKTSGVGTVEKRQTILVDLLQKMDPISAKHLVRIPLGTSRLGIGDPTVLDALALSLGGGRQNRKVLEGAYNRTSDLGLIAKVLCQGGLSEVEKLEVTVGRPIRPQLAERLPDAKTILEKMGGRVHIQYKYDGVRVQIHKEGDSVRLFSRNLEETTPMMPEITRGTLSQVKAKSVILDAEALAYNPTSDEFLPFQETAKRRRKYKIEEMAKSLPLRAFVFDVMYVDGKSLIDEPLEKRMKVLEEVVTEGDILLPEPGEFTEKVERIEELFNDALTKGLEGLLVKRPGCLYEAGGRNFNWVKLKRHSAGELKDTIDCVILGYVFGKGKRAGFGAGALLVGVYDSEKDEFVTVSRIGTGLTDEEWRKIKDQSAKIKVDHKPARVNSLTEPSVWIAPEIVIEVLADEITRSPIHTAGKEGSEPGYALRFPRLVRFREDKRPEDSTTVKELIEMYNLQFKK